MKQIFVCERCGKNFESEEAALKCERKHKENDERAQKLAEEKQSRLQEINDLSARLKELRYNYIKDYEESNATSPLYNMFFRM
jgi:DNA-directed RNA polymerase subunit RPC12/RpoP